MGMQMFWASVFWACSGVLLYVYVLCPLVVRTLEVLLGKRAKAVYSEAPLDHAWQERPIRNLDVLIRERHLLNPLKYGLFAWQLWSAQVLRYASPLLWFGAFVANVVLARDALLGGRHYLYLGLLIGQISLLVAGLVGFMLQDHRGELGTFDKPYRFIRTNLASLITMLRYLAECATGWILAPQFWIIVVLIAYLVLRHITAAPDAAMSHPRSHHHISPPTSAAAPERPDDR
jgi:hypothetical protein